jgi:hypothetical protein
MKTRKELPHFLNSLNLIGEGVEVGVYKADFSAHILKYWKGRALYMVDPWCFQNRKLDASDANDSEQLSIYREAVEKVKPFKTRAKICKDKSTDAASAFPVDADATLDFVYLDACHDYRSVWLDLLAWYPRVKKGGIISGHDYKNSCVRKNLVEVKRAVDNFFRVFEGKVLTTTDDNLPTWFVFK